MNSSDVMRMLQRLRQPQNFQPDQPAPAPAPALKLRIPKKKRAITPPSSDSEYSDSDSESDGYVELSQIKEQFEKDPCEYVSPAGLKATKTKKEAIQYLESKQCPKIKSVKRATMEGPPAPPMSESPTVKAKKVRKAKVADVVPALPEVSAPAPPKVKKAKKVAEALPAVAVPAPAPAAAEKKKRPPTAYAVALGKHRKAGLSFGDAAKAAKAEVDAAKAK